MGFGVEFDPPVEVLFRHCDNSNNAGLTGTVHEGMKARGGTPEGSGASLRRRSSSRRSLSQRRNARPVRLVSARPCRHSCFMCRALRYHRFLPPPFISRYFIQIRRRDIAHTGSFTESAPTMLFQALRAVTAYARSRTRKASLLSETKGYFIDERNRTGYVFVIDTAEIHDLSMSLLSRLLRDAESRSIKIWMRE